MEYLCRPLCRDISKYSKYERQTKLLSMRCLMEIVSMTHYISIHIIVNNISSECDNNREYDNNEWDFNLCIQTEVSYKPRLRAEDFIKNAIRLDNNVSMLTTFRIHISIFIPFDVLFETNSESNSYAKHFSSCASHSWGWFFFAFVCVSLCSFVRLNFSIEKCQESTRRVFAIDRMQFYRSHTQNRQWL